MPLTNPEKIALVIPPYSKGNIVSDYMAGLGLKVIGSESCLPPLETLYIATILDQNKFQVKIIDAAAEGLDLDKVTSLLKDFKPDKIFIDIRYSSFINDLKIASGLKSGFPFVAIFGPMAHFFANEINERYDIDLVVKGNPAVEIPKILGIKEPGQNLDNLPIPKRSLLSKEKYFFRTLPKKPFTTVITSQGCPYGCIYCPYFAIQGKLVNKRAPESVIRELIQIREEGYRSVLFRDPIFTLDRDHVTSICEGMIKNKLGLEWWCETRADKLDQEMLSLMKRAGLKGINFGVESGDEEVARLAGRKSDEKEKIKETIKVSRRLGISTKAFFILGLPGETRETMERTIKSAVELDPDYVVFMLASPFPGTQLFDLFLKAHSRDVFFKEEDIYYVPPGLTLDELKRHQKTGILRFYLRPRHILKEIKFLCNIANAREALAYWKWMRASNFKEA